MNPDDPWDTSEPVIPTVHFDCNCLRCKIYKIANKRIFDHVEQMTLKPNYDEPQVIILDEVAEVTEQQLFHIINRTKV